MLCCAALCCRDSRHWLPDVKFSPDGKCFSLASMDHKIYIYDKETFRLKGTCDRHNSHVQGFDYSQDSVYIQSDSGDYEHLYFEAEDGEYFSSGSQLKDIVWADWTCLFGWPVQGEGGRDEVRVACHPIPMLCCDVMVPHVSVALLCSAQGRGRTSTTSRRAWPRSPLQCIGLRARTSWPWAIRAGRSGS